MIMMRSTCFIIFACSFLPTAEANAQASTETGASTRLEASSSPVEASNGFDAKTLYAGAQFTGNLTMHSLESTEGMLGAGGSLSAEFIIIPYFGVGLEVGYASMGYENKLVTESGANIVDDGLNLYVDSDDKISKRGGRGEVRSDAIVLPILLKGRYPISVGKNVMFLAPFLNLGAQMEFGLSSNYAIQNDDTFDYATGSNEFDLKLLGGLGLDFSMGKAGMVGLEVRYLFGATQAPETRIQINSRPNAATESEFPIDFVVPENRWSHLELLLHYRYGFAFGAG